MDLYTLISTYGKGLGESKMWESIKAISEELAPLKESDKQMYWNMMRRAYGSMSNGHYNKEFAEHDVEKIKYTDKDGKIRSGAYWTAEQVEEAMRDFTFPASVTIWDKYVAANIMRSDLCKKMDDTQVLTATYMFFFADEDWPNPATKVWDYMCCKWSKK